MNIDTTSKENLEKLLAIEPGLMDELAAARNAVSRIKAAAERHSLGIGPEILAAYIQDVGVHEVNDEQLGGLAGGRGVFMPNTILRSERDKR